MKNDCSSSALSLFTLAILLLASTASYAQNNCYSTFSVDFTEGCAPLSIIVTSHVSNENPLYFYEEDQPPTDEPTHTYTRAGVYELVRIISPSCANTVSDTIQIRVYDNTPPTFEVDSCLRSSRLTFTDTLYPWYQAWVNPPNAEVYQVGVFQRGETVDLDESSASYEVIVRGTLSDQQTYCGESRRAVTPYQSLPKPVAQQLSWASSGELSLGFSIDTALTHLLAEQQPGGNYQVSVPEVKSEELELGGRNISVASCYQLGVLSNCTDPFSITDPSLLPAEQLATPLCNFPYEAIPEEGFNLLTWGDYTAGNMLVSSVNIIRDGELLASIADSTIQSYSDAKVVCGRTYCYNLEINLASGGKVVMPEACIAPLSSGLALEATQLRSSWEGDSLVVGWEIDTTLVSNMRLFALRNGQFALEDITGLSYTDTVAMLSADSIACYYLEVTDSCGNISISDTTCSMYLQAVVQAVGNELLWSPFQGLNRNFEYRIEVQEPGANWELLGQIDAQTSSFLHEKDAIANRVNRYRVVAQSLANPALTAYSNVIELEEKVVLQIADAFTPNDDGLNEHFHFSALRLQSAAFKIFNRQGVLMYEGTESSEGWDGTYQGRRTPTGAYVYLIEGIDDFGETFVRKGTFLLLRL